MLFHDFSERKVNIFLTLLYCFIIMLCYIILTTTYIYAGTVKLAWDASISPEIVGYKIYYGTSSGSYSDSVYVGNVFTCTIENLIGGKTYYFAATAVDADNNESGYSNEVFTFIGTNIIIDYTAITGVTSGESYTGTINISGGIEPYTFELVDGVLPAGLTLNNNIGIISGTLQKAGTYIFTVKATDSVGQEKFIEITVNVTLGAPLELIINSSEDGSIN